MPKGPPWDGEHRGLPAPRARPAGSPALAGDVLPSLAGTGTRQLGPGNSRERGFILPGCSPKAKARWLQPPLGSQRLPGDSKSVPRAGRTRGRAESRLKSAAQARRACQGHWETCGPSQGMLQGWGGGHSWLHDLSPEVIKSRMGP